MFFSQNFDVQIQLYASPKEKFRMPSHMLLFSSVVTL
jgi:hypothetical protein